MLGTAELFLVPIIYETIANAADRLDVHIVRERIEAPVACGLNDPGERLLEARATGPRAARVLEAWRATLRTAGH